MLKELMAKSLCEDNHYNWEESIRLGGNSVSEKYLREAIQILNLFKAEVDKLTVMTDAEVDVILEKGFDISIKPESLNHIQRIIQHQNTKKQLLDLMGNLVPIS